MIYQGVLDWRQSGEFRSTGWQAGQVYYPPLYYTLLLPFSHLEFKVVAYFFYFLQFVLFTFAIVLMAKAVTNQRTPSLMEYGIAAVLTVNFHPLLETMAFHKVEGIEFFLICLAVYLFRKKRDLLCGAVLLLAANLKYLPGILIGYFLIKRQTRLLLGVLAAGVVVFLALVPALGLGTLWSYTVEYPLKVLFSPEPATNHVTAHLEWQSLSGTIYRLFSPPATPEVLQYRLKYAIGPVAHGHLAFGIAAFLKVILGGLYLAFIRKRWSASQRDKQWAFYLLEISLTLLMIVVFAVATRPHYGILYLPAFVFVGLLLYQQWDLFHLKEKMLFFVAYSMSGMIFPGGLLNQLPAHPLWGKQYSTMYWWSSLLVYGYGLLGLCILLCYRRLLQARGRNESA